MNVFIAQFLLLWRTRRAPLLLGSLLLILTFFAYMWDRWSPVRRVAGANTELQVLILGAMLLYVMAAVGAFWGLAIWRSETPRQRDYHASLPVHTAAHELARVAAGGVWLFIAVALVCFIVASALALAGAMGGESGPPGAYWTMPFAVAFITFMITTCVGIASDAPNEWLLSTLVVLTLLLVATVSAPAGQLWMIDTFFMGRFGIGRALAGALGMGVTSRYGMGFMLEDVGMWRDAAVFWLVAGCVAVFATTALRSRSVARD